VARKKLGRWCRQTAGDGAPTGGNSGGKNKLQRSRGSIKARRQGGNDRKEQQTHLLPELGLPQLKQVLSSSILKTRATMRCTLVDFKGSGGGSKVASGCAAPKKQHQQASIGPE
jgi:hypothetical protein